MALRWTEGKKLRILDFDIENRPLSYLGMDFTTSDITAIAWSWVGEKRVHCAALADESDSYMTQDEMLHRFLDAYEAADVVTGHYIRKHDLPIINGALLEHDIVQLSPKLTCDTKMDLVKRSGISASQESLAEMYGIPAGKYHMSQTKWREANRLTPEGIALTRKRVIDDVIQHKALRERLLEAGALHPPKVWRP